MKLMEPYSSGLSRTILWSLEKQVLHNKTITYLIKWMFHNAKEMQLS